MSQIDVIKEVVRYEQLLRENSSNHVLKGEYLIRDSQYPDMKEVLGVDAKANITNKEILGDKLMVEGNLSYIVFYLPKDEVLLDDSVNRIHSVIFTDKFANYLDLNNDEHSVWSDVECEIEHIEANWMNERKVGIDGVMTLRWQVYKNGEFEYVKDIEGKDDVQILKKEESLNGLKGQKEIELMGKTILKVTMDKPEIEEVLKCTINIHKKEVKLAEEKFYVGFYCKVIVLYKAKDTKGLCCLEDDVYLSKEEELPGVNQDMIPYLKLSIKDYECNVDTDDLGEARLVNIEFLVKGRVKVYSKEALEMLKDAYSPTMNLELIKERRTFGDILSMINTNVMVKDNIRIGENQPRIDQIITSYGSPIILDKSIEGNRVRVEGIIKLSIIYKVVGEELDYGIMHQEVPFTNDVDLKAYNKDAQAVVKANLESLDTLIEGNNISIRGNIGLEVKAVYDRIVECVVDMLEGEVQESTNKSSITIYVVGNNDTLWELAKKYNTTIEELRRLNNLESNYEVKTGDKLIILGRAIF